MTAATPPYSSVRVRAVRSTSMPAMKNKAPVLIPWLIIWIRLPCTAVAFSAKIPSRMNPMWLMLP